MSGSASPQVQVVEESSAAAQAGMADGDAVIRLAARLAQLDLDAPTVELLLAALAADECDPYSMA